MPYNGKTNWQNNEIVEATDLNRIEQGIVDATNDLDTKLPADDYTAEDVLNKLKTVDGSGSGLDAEFLDGKASSEFATAAHNHDDKYLGKSATATDSTKLGGQLPSAYALAAHDHDIADVSNLQTALNGKAASSHTHTIANVTNLQTTLNGKAPSVLYGSTVPASLLPGQIFVKI